MLVPQKVYEEFLYELANEVSDRLGLNPHNKERTLKTVRNMMNENGFLNGFREVENKVITMAYVIAKENKDPYVTPKIVAEMSGMKKGTLITYAQRWKKKLLTEN